MQNRANFEDFNITEAEAKKFIRLGIGGELQFEVMDNQASQYRLLNERQLNELYSNHPEKKPIRLADNEYNTSLYRIEKVGYEQPINYQDIWFDRSKFELILVKYPDLSKHKDQLVTEESLHTSSYWRYFTKLTLQAIQKYPEWKKNQDKIQITGNVAEWLKSLGINSREADVIKKTLSDFFEELK